MKLQYRVGIIYLVVGWGTVVASYNAKLSGVEFMPSMIVGSLVVLLGVALLVFEKGE